MQARFFFAAAGVLALCACGGGGSTTPAAPTPGPSGPPAVTTATVRFTIGNGQNVQSARRPQYFSPHTQSVAVTYAGKSYVVDFIQGSNGCTGAIPNVVCTIQFTALVGSDTFGITAYDAYSGSGRVLSQTQVTANVAPGTNDIKAVLDGVPVTASVQKAIDLPEGIATSIPVTVTAYDADGSAIVGPGNYTAPVALSDSDVSGATGVTASVTGPGAQGVITWNGSGSVFGLDVTARIGNFSSQGQATGLLRVVPQYAQYNTPSGRNAVAIAAASDGSLFVIEGGTPFGVTMALAHVASTGNATEIPLSSTLGQGVASAVVGPDGAVWCSTGPNYGPLSSEIVRIDASGNATAYKSASLSYPGRIVVGPDNRLWFVQRGGIGAIDTSGTFTFYAYLSTPNGSAASFGDITAGPDGNVWATVGGQTGLLRITPSGTMTFFPVAVNMTGAIATQGSRFDVTFGNMLYQLDASGAVQATYTLPVFPSGGPLTTASNGSVWMLAGGDVAGGSAIDRVSAGGAASAIDIPYPGDPGNGMPQITQFARAADGSMWYVRGNTYGRIVVH